MVGVQVERVSITSLGIQGDRNWAIRDNVRGGIRGAKKIGDLMQFSARPCDDGSSDAIITLPNGREVLTSAHDVSEILSEILQHSVTLEQLPTNDNLEHFRRGPADSSDVMAELRGIFGRTEDEPLPDFSAFPPEVSEFESPPGTHHDCWPLLVMTTSALQALSAALPESAIDVLRFRPSIVIQNEMGSGHEEFSWKGKTATLGSTVVEFLDPCPRCVMITRRINDQLPEDRSILRHVVRDLNQAVGVYARVVSAGQVNVGDSFVFQD